MNCLIVLFKPGVHFSCIKEIKDILELNLPKYSYELDDWTSFEIDQSPFTAACDRRQCEAGKNRTGGGQCKTERQRTEILLAAEKPAG